MTDHIIENYRDYIRRGEALPFTNPTNDLLMAKARKDLADYLEYKAGRMALADLSLALQEQISGWEMPAWGTYGT